MSKMYLRLLLGMAVLARLVPSVAQTAVPAYLSSRGYDAAAFGHWQLAAGPAPDAPGVASIVVEGSGDLALPAGPAFQPLAVGLPVLVADGLASETVVPTALACAAGACTLTAVWSHPHPGHFTLSSADGGLQEAVNYATAHGGGVVQIGPDFAGPLGVAPITALAAGDRTTLIEDSRAGDAWYGWNGASYAATFALSSQPTWLDVRTFGASGSQQSTTAACTAGSTEVSLAAPLDFDNSQGIALAGCGPAPFAGASFQPPVPVVVNFCGQNGVLACTPGTTTYRYQIAVADAAEGFTAVGATAATATAAANLGFGCCNLVGGANLLTWSAPDGLNSNNDGYLVYGEKAGDANFQLIGLVTIPGYAQPWQPSTAYAAGRYARPQAAPNGSYYVALTGGTTAATEPAWRTSTPTCTVGDGSVTWQRVPFSWLDECTDSTGPTACTAAINWTPNWVPRTPPLTPSPDVWVSQIVAGGGSRTLTLQTPAATTAPAAAALHDDTAALSAAVAAQQRGCIQIAPSGYSPDDTCAPLWFPLGGYNVSGPIPFSAALLIHGISSAALFGQNPFQPIFIGSARRVTVEGLHTFGSLTPYAITEASDTNVFSLKDIDAQFATDYVAEFLACASASCGASAEISGRFVGDRRLAFSSIDWLKVDPQTWVEPIFSNSQPWEAQIYGSGEWLAINGMVGVPQPKPYDRWVDNWSGNVTIDNGTRLGSENGGMSAIYTFAGHGGPPSWMGSSLVIRDSSVGTGSAGGAGNPASGIIVALNGTFPQQVTVESDANLVTTPLIDTCSGINIANANAPCVLPAGFAPTNLDTAFNDTLNQSQTVAIHATSTSNAGLRCFPLQAALQPYVPGPAACLQASAPPSAGIWPTGSVQFNNPHAFVWNQNPQPGQPLGWTLQPTVPGSTVRAAPVWQPNHGYTLAASPFGEGSDYVTDGAGNVFYVSAVALGATCTSAAAAPSWNIARAGNTTADGNCTWTYDATPASAWLGFGTVYPNASDTSVRFVGALTTTNATSDTIAVAGLTVAGHCSLQATNATAAAMSGVTCVAASGTVVVSHPAVAGGVFNVFLSYR